MPTPIRHYKRAPSASYDAGAQHRRALIAKVKIAAKELGICDDDYRAILLRVTGKSSSTACSEHELVAIVEEFKRQGWQATPKKAVTRAADHPAANKARALWISLHQLGAIDDAAEAALEIFARRQLGCLKLQWADQGQMFKLIEALKAMAERHGWDQSTANTNNGSHVIRVLKVRLLTAILEKLKAKGFAAEHWNVAGAAIAIAGFEKARGTGPMSWELGELDMLAGTFGRLLRTGQREQ